MLNYSFLAVSIAGAVPGFIGLYYFARDYWDQFNQDHFGNMFILGLILGTISSFFLLASQVSFLIAPFILFTLIPLVETLLKTIIFGRKRYLGKDDTPFYPLSFSFGYGSATAIAIGYLSIQSSGGSTTGATILLIGLLLFDYAVVHGMIGLVVGLNVRDQQIGMAITQGTSMQIPLSLLATITIIYTGGHTYGIVAIILAFMYAVGILFYGKVSLLPRIMTSQMKFKRRKRDGRLRLED